MSMLFLLRQSRGLAAVTPVRLVAVDAERDTNPIPIPLVREPVSHATDQLFVLLHPHTSPRRRIGGPPGPLLYGSSGACASHGPGAVVGEWASQRSHSSSQVGTNPASRTGRTTNR